MTECPTDCSGELGPLGLLNVEKPNLGSGRICDTCGILVIEKKDDT